MSVGSNGIRGLITFITGLLLARGLHPSGYGDFMFLLGSFVAIRSLLDMGTSSAFYTFLSQRTRGNRFYLLYFFWLIFQLSITALIVALIIPQSVFERIWLGHERGIVFLAFLATFVQYQVWQTVGQIGEAKRKTAKVQLLNVTVATTYLFMVFLLSILNSISIEKIFFLLIGLYTVATLLAYWVLKENKKPIIDKQATFQEIVKEYWMYCAPLIWLSFFTFIYDFADKWMLQKFGHAIQQGYFQVANQFSVICLLATTSILRVFWKEIADAWSKDDNNKIAHLYLKVSRGLVIISAIISGLLLPWSEQIVIILLGLTYIQAWPVLAIMLLYPIHQSMGQIGGTMLLASGNTKKYMFVSISIMLISVPLSYFMLAPTSSELFPGLELGAIGLASKMVLLGIISVNIQALVIARYNGWKFDWKYQVTGIPIIIALGYIAKFLTELLFTTDKISISNLLVPGIFTGITYILLVMLLIFWQPWLIGFKRNELVNQFQIAFSYLMQKKE